MRYINICLRYKYLILGVTLGVTAITVAFCAITLMLPVGKNPLPNQFTAEATILIQRNPSSDFTASIVSALSSGGMESSLPVGFEYSALLMRMLQSRVILDRIAQDLDIAGRFSLDPSQKTRIRALLLGRTQFQHSKTTSTITISFRDTNPVFARDVVNRMVELLDDWFTETWGLSSQKQRTLLEQKQVEVRDQIAQLEDQLRTLQRKYGFLNSQDMTASQTATLANLRAQLILKEMDIKNYSGFANTQDPRLVQLNTERQNILAMIRQVQEGSTDTAPPRLPDDNLPGVAQQYATLSQQLETQRGIYNTLSRQYEVAKLATEPLPVFQILESAEVPDHKSGPRRSIIVMKAAVFAFLASIAFSLIINTLRRVRGMPVPIPGPDSISEPQRMIEGDR
jgi:uncharacterized protein involved in exopolysaccharide biosynthesis